MSDGNELPPPPRNLFIEVTTECNLRCRQCHMWRSQEPSTSLSTREKTALLPPFAAWSPQALVVLTGGEPLLKQEEFFSLTRTCRQNALRVSVNTNATLVQEDTLERLLTEGPHYLVVSLDSHRPALHDWVRGRPGTYARVLSLLQRLLHRRNASRSSDLSILVNTIIFEGNVEELDAHVTFLRGLGVDGVSFQMLARTFMRASREDVFFARHFPREVSRVEAAIERLLKLKARGAPIVTTENDLRWMKLYARDPDFLGEQVCGSAERNMMVDQQGNVQLCFFMRELLDGRVIGNVREKSLRTLWESDLARHARGVMEGCRKNCGMLNCHRKQELS
ncbi:radical SAM superfamily protein [Cystobacter fuscus DSM 2262]|uniref:Radical SAM superfamily protein n=1 Tax=Cystobacter fuscus (strain ATCC 25194 / DSM 2262 / NBRC 100088 / M29) TaxID=1242864 RepID=S9NVK8_CYSF2|nr:radical SAM protein [Cystobacter fuscus]EPX54956.1 radical SAM superfamily protein [Cystobacter fuscus DSM 2262]